MAKYVQAPFYAKVLLNLESQIKTQLCYVDKLTPPEKKINFLYIANFFNICLVPPSHHSLTMEKQNTPFNPTPLTLRGKKILKFYGFFSKYR